MKASWDVLGSATKLARSMLNELVDFLREILDTWNW